MAKVNPKNERSERDYKSDVNQAVAETESEIFEDALGTEPLDNDGDTSLEEMGEGLEGEDLEEEDDEDDTEEEAKEAAKEGDSEAEETDEDEAEDEEDEAEEEPPRDERGRFQEQERPDQREIPLRAERDRRRQAEADAEALRREIAELRGRVDEQSRRPPTPPPVESPKPKPDMFADPDGYDRWIRDGAKQEAQEYVQRELANYQQQQQARQEERVNLNLQLAARGDRGWEFGQAYNSLVALDKNNSANRALVQRIFDAPDPGKELFSWWDENGGEEYREQILERLTNQPYGAQRSSQDRGNSRQRSQQPRHVTQIPDSVRRQPPSLNSARGGQRHEIPDPEMMDDSDDAVFRFATRR